MSNPLRGTVNLPGSKSESNRALMIAAYGGFPLEANNLSEAHDTVLLKTLLENMPMSPAELATVDCEDAGSAARFLMTYLASMPGTWLLTGTERLCQRPMAPLIDALGQLGADITCVEKQGCLPVRIHGKKLYGGRAKLDASLSSQFASSLLMAAPTWEQGLQLTMIGNPVSMPYLEMTLTMMEYFGVQPIRDGNVIAVAPQQYHSGPIKVSADWSAASYWYEMMALSDGGTLLLKGLKSNSMQGDAAVVDMFARLGVKTDFLEDGIRISKTESVSLSVSEPLIFDFKHTPDLFPSVFVTCVAMHIDTVFVGISTLYMKESDRVNTLITELSKIYTFINIVYDDKIIIKKSSLSNKNDNIEKVIFNTYHDHRIAMALVGLLPQVGLASIDDLMTVNKSYPKFWDDITKIF